MNNVLYDPAEITRRSYEYIDDALDLEAYSEREQIVAKRIVHTSGDLGLVDHLEFHGDPILSAENAFNTGIPIVTDVSMVESGLRRNMLDSLGLKTYCYVHDDRVSERAKTNDLTRSATALDMALDRHDKFVLAVGNAPTVLHRLFERTIDTNRIPCVVGAPVGFVGVESSKKKLRNSHYDSVMITRSRGGSPLAASIINALMKILLEN